MSYYESYMNLYYESYMNSGSEEKAIEQARADTVIAIFFFPDRVEAIEEALNRAVADMREREESE